MNDEKFMRLAIKKAKEGVTSGQTPFGACIVDREGKVIATEHNVVWSETDITMHAEIHAIRTANKKLGKIKLKDCTIYSTTEPCPMCFSAIHWAGIKRIVFGTEINDAKEFGFSELPISNEQMKELGQSPIEITANILKEETLKVFKDWKSKNPKTY